MNLPILILMSITLFSCSKTEGTPTVTNTPEPIQTNSNGSTVLHDQVIKSKIVGRDMYYTVYLPAGYSNEKTYPVLYLLHGYGGNQNDWFVYDKLQEQADKAIADFIMPEAVIITPDGNTWMYLDNVAGRSIRYESYFFQEFLPQVEKRFHIKGERQSRMIGGFSMGGYGALYYGITHRDMFSYIYAMSAVIEGYGVRNIYEVIQQYPQNELPPVTLELGTRDFFTRENQRLHQQLTAANYPHDYILREGGHDWEFWSACTPKILKKFGETIKNKPYEKSHITTNSLNS